MQASPLQRLVEPRRLAIALGAVEGSVPIASLPRLQGLILAAREDEFAWLRLRFAQDSQRRVTMRGRLEATLRLQCQRCLEALPWPVQRELQLVAVADEDAAAQVPRDWDAVVVLGAQGLDLPVLVEDELILALPVAARCEDERCVRAAVPGTGAKGAHRPFAALARAGAGFDSNRPLGQRRES